MDDKLKLLRRGLLSMSTGNERMMALICCTTTLICRCHSLYRPISLNVTRTAKCTAKCTATPEYCAPGQPKQCHFSVLLLPSTQTWTLHYTPATPEITWRRQMLIASLINGCHFRDQRILFDQCRLWGSNDLLLLLGKSLRQELPLKLSQIA